LPLTQLQIEHRAPHWPLGTPFVELEQVEHELPGVVQLATPQHTPSVQWVLVHWSSDVQFAPSGCLMLANDRDVTQKSNGPPTIEELTTK
jgi:hypothetical protein